MTLLRPQSLSIAWDKRANGKMGRGKTQQPTFENSFVFSFPSYPKNHASLAKTYPPGILVRSTCGKSSCNLVLRFPSSPSSAMPVYILGNLSTRRFWGNGDVYKRASLGKRAPSFPPRSKLKQRGFFATATLSKPASKA